MSQANVELLAALCALDGDPGMVDVQEMVSIVSAWTQRVGTRK